MPEKCIHTHWQVAQASTQSQNLPKSMSALSRGLTADEKARAHNKGYT